VSDAPRYANLRDAELRGPEVTAGPGSSAPRPSLRAQLAALEARRADDAAAAGLLEQALRRHARMQEALAGCLRALHTPGHHEQARTAILWKLAFYLEYGLETATVRIYRLVRGELSVIGDPPSALSALAEQTAVWSLFDGQSSSIAACAPDEPTALSLFPLCPGGELWGAIMVRPQPGRELGAQERQLLETAVDVLEIALRRWQAVDELQQREHQLRVLVADMGRLNTELEQRVAARTEELTAANRELRDNSRLLRTIVNSLGDALVLLDRAGCVLLANRAAGALCRCAPEQLIGRQWQDVCPFRAPQIEQALADGVVFCGREQATIEGARLVLDVQVIQLFTGSGHGQMLLHMADVSERLRVEEVALQNERLAAMGRLAAMVAHEVNSPLQAIQNFLFLADDEQPAQQTYLAMISDEIERIGTLLHRLLDLQRPADVATRQVDLNRLIERVLTLMSSSLARNRVVAIWPLSSVPLEVVGRSDNLIQVLLNLLLNAIDAMPEGGQLRIDTRVRPTRPDDGLPAPASQLVELTISDTGSGIPGEVFERLFEPFFTTKQAGSGLGLAISSQIVAEHGGVIRAQNRPERGASFSLLLPAAEPDLNETVHSHARAASLAGL
jgi:PAS domain S-box-containing protein